MEISSLLKLFTELPENMSLTFINQHRHLQIKIRCCLLNETYSTSRLVPYYELRLARTPMLLTLIEQLVDELNIAVKKDENGPSKQTEDSRG